MAQRVSISNGRKESVTENENILVPTPSQFEKLYLAPEKAVAGDLRLKFGNPTPVALGGFLLANTPATIMLMGWRGAGGGAGDATAGVGGIGEWILGNTFSSVVFFTFGGYWGAFGATVTPFYNAVAAYQNAAGFYNSFAWFLLWMGVLCLLYAIAALRTNICLVAILLCFTITFPCLTASYFAAADGHMALAVSTRVAGAAFAFVASIVAWYLWFSMILESVDFPLTLPVGDLSKFVKGKSEKSMV
ncbi:hypothetical protein LTS08_001240 [Lithohypha guttulata]|uniref:Uncharacterized protein n=1 Tax=Lithohypha guttulata TaxID=1690604 RepID=A0AAN7SU86_9EURO|nr:hypothetical protein LTR51_007759 [Lithohypha guttulata]KAK5081661.1 hypothetical protein LTR05_007794 [Lithohypha guttulata]KAK5104967.1 hypothetical protein LTS08_001240 [Lithohypha guttulata]